MNILNLIEESIDLFKNKKFDEAITKLSQALDQIENKDSHIQEQNNIQFWLGRCYLEQAMKAKGEASTRLFEQAIEHHQQQLRLAKQLEGENSIQEQNNAQHWLGRCYFEQAMKAKEKDAVPLFEQAAVYFRQSLEFAKQLTDEQNSIQEQTYAQHWLGCSYLAHAKEVRGNDLKLLRQAVKCFKQQLRLSKQLGGKDSIQKQIYAQYWLGSCYLEQAIAIKDEKTSRAKKLAQRAEKYYLSTAERLSQLIDESEKEKLKKIINELPQEYYFLREKWLDYFEQKKKGIREKLFKNKEDGNKEDDLTNAILTILAVLNISPIELGSTPLAHYTSPSVCEKLFDIVQNKNDVNNKDKDPVDEQQANPMRISSSTYMNDPTEGEGLLDLLNLQDLELENKADCPEYNAFFACFSSRVNDLNQFRLYGKENGVEASGCCLVFNKDGNWLKEPDVSVSFRSMAKKRG